LTKHNKQLVNNNNIIITYVLTASKVAWAET